MFLKYAGPRVQITHSGVNAQEHHPDKYIYFHILFTLYKTIEKTLAKTNPFIYIPSKDKVSDDDMLAWVDAYHPDVLNEIKVAIVDYKKHLKDDLARISHNNTLNEEEKDSWKENLELMQEYRLQRAKNKIFYGYMVDSVVESILAKELTHFVFPYSLKRFHVVQAIANHTKRQSKRTKPLLFIKEKDGSKYIYLIFEQYI